jgi:hypothetical protein
LPPSLARSRGNRWLFLFRDPRRATLKGRRSTSKRRSAGPGRADRRACAGATSQTRQRLRCAIHAARTPPLFAMAGAWTRDTHGATCRGLQPGRSHPAPGESAARRQGLPGHHGRAGLPSVSEGRRSRPSKLISCWRWQTVPPKPAPSALHTRRRPGGRRQAWPQPQADWRTTTASCWRWPSRSGMQPGQHAELVQHEQPGRAAGRRQRTSTTDATGRQAKAHRQAGLRLESHEAA